MSEGKEVVNWKERIAARAQEVKEEEQAAVTMLSLASGIMSLGETQVPNNELTGVILAIGTERTWYNRSYDPDDKSPPNCYSQKIGNDDPFNPTMIPAANVPEPPAENCADCPYSKMGSAIVGKGPGCKTRRRLLLAPASVVNDPSKLGKQLVIINVPPTSGKNFSSYVAKLSGSGVPPEAAITRIKYGPDKKTMFAMHFEPVAPIENDEALSAIFSRIDEFPHFILGGYNYEEQEEPAPETKGKKKY